MAKSSPAFQFYPESYLAGTALFSHDQKGIYVDLLCFQWSMGRLPKEIKLLARLVHCSEKKLSLILQKFAQDERGYFNERLELERVKQEEYRTKQAELAGRRWPKNQDANPDANAYAKAHSLAMPAGKSIENIDSSDFFRREGIGEGMRSDGFPEAWRDWRAYRAEKNEPLTSYTASASMQKCLRWGPKKSVEIIRNSIEKSWKNLLEPSDLLSKNTSQSSKEKPATKPKLTPHQQSIENVKSHLGTKMSDSEKHCVIGFLKTLEDSAILAHFDAKERREIVLLVPNYFKIPEEPNL